MITKTQWNKFCLDVWYLRSQLGYANVEIKGQGVRGIELRGDVHVLMTNRSGGGTPTVYTYDEVTQWMNLAYLYSQVHVSSNMNAIFPFLKRGEWLQDRTIRTVKVR